MCKAYFMQPQNANKGPMQTAQHHMLFPPAAGIGMAAPQARVRSEAKHRSDSGAMQSP